MVVGLVLGAIAAFSVSRVLASVLFLVAPTDPITYAFVTASLAVGTAGAYLIPAVRAARVEPIEALRGP